MTTDLVLGISSAPLGKLETNVSMKLSSVLSFSSGCSERFFLNLPEQRFAFSNAFKKASFAFEKLLAFGIVLLLSTAIVREVYGVVSSQSGEGKQDSK